ncbi:flagellar hook-associated protein FlgL [Arthrobacter zhaoguopingii]|uniref:flagellar hook-associated protein FlgL n=1 Tax=Arthrobacter zhaoguopingii TaxID=2681491 RepID=UPI00135719F2|nr:flagellar hook-associated protein FlgL [Arthrobacter zhaoguopingii]
MLSRVTNTTMTNTAQRNLQASMMRRAEAQEHAMTLKRISRPSQDPMAAADSLRVKADQQSAAQYTRNIDNGKGWLTALDSALSNTSKLMTRVRELTIQGGNETLSPAARNAIAVEVEGLKRDLLGQANTRFLGRSVFAGNSDAEAAFTGTPPVFTGAPGSTVERRVGEGQTIRVDADGAAVFGNGPGSVFDLLDGIAADLRAGISTSARLGAVDAQFNRVSAGQAEIGARHSRLLNAEDTNKVQVAALEEQRAGIEDLDLAEMLTNLKIQDLSYQGALSVTSKVLSPTLLDFLR